MKYQTCCTGYMHVVWYDIQDYHITFRMTFLILLCDAI